MRRIRAHRPSAWHLLAPVGPMMVVAWWLRAVAPTPTETAEVQPPASSLGNALGLVAAQPTPVESSPEPPLTSAVGDWLASEPQSNVVTIRLRPEEQPRGPRVLPPEAVRERFYGDRSKRWVALTFDDGPSRENTPRILDILERHRVHATFFVLGRRAHDMPDLVEEIHDGGHEIGNHSWSHGSFRSLWKSQIVDELTRTDGAVYDAIGLHPALVRPPYGRYAPSAVPIFGSLGMHAILWSVDSQDWDEPDAQVIADNVIDGAHDGAIVLLHDRTSTTVHALPHILQGLQQRGFEIVPVSELTGHPAYRDDDATERYSQLGSSVIMASTLAASARDRLRPGSQR